MEFDCQLLELKGHSGDSVLETCGEGTGVVESGGGAK